MANTAAGIAGGTGVMPGGTVILKNCFKFYFPFLYMRGIFEAWCDPI